MGNYNYFINDYLGNVRAVLTWEEESPYVIGGSPSTYSLTQRNDYYAFGLPTLTSTHSEAQPYKREGKEYDEMHGLNTYDQGARQFNTHLPITTTSDPLAEKYYSISPYAQWGNNPVRFVDPDGRKIIFYIRSSSERKVLKFTYTAQGTLQDSNGKTVTVPTDSHPGQILEGYNKMLNSGDENYVHQIMTLINSDNIHVIDTRIKSSGGGEVVTGSESETVSEAKAKAINGKGIGTTTKYNFSEKSFSSGLKKSNYTTVAHEVQHQYDFDQGKMADHYDKEGKRIEGSKNPAETRAVKNEDYAREKEGFEKRIEY